MLIACPNCKKQFQIDEAYAVSDQKLRCSNCRAVFRLVSRQAPAAAPATAAPRPVAPAAPAPPAAPAAPVQAPIVPRAPVASPVPAAGATDGVKVVLANESAAFCEAVRKILANEPFELFVCTDGKVALETVERERPQVLLLDVALPTMFGFEVVERVRQNPELAGIKVVLIASIYDKTRYKRSPNSLYGADDYLEKHHIPDSLVPMIHRLVSGASVQPSAPPAKELARQEISRDEIRQAETEGTRAAEPAAQAELSEAQLKARRLARIIVSDIALYSQAKVEQGVREGNFYQLLAEDIREGEQLYRQRVPESVREKTDYLKEAFEELIAKKRAELNL
ncbi:hypothetical protein GMST_40890 [Geomonas silvestris]|uniref:Response regulatory domain-containing protein n=1 Tax=Geomonas silvestris TaxID=2740184 RepID=A0A6V8MPA0_9BACT|nr:response regulator [Geomonas silvestris]GFO61764.1 hypothetical protein GMST_40890 [Geomonas silvestris]